MDGEVNLRPTPHPQRPPKRARIQGSQTCVSLSSIVIRSPKLDSHNPKLDSNKEEEALSSMEIRKKKKWTGGWTCAPRLIRSGLPRQAQPPQPRDGPASDRDGPAAGSLRPAPGCHWLASGPFGGEELQGAGERGVPCRAVGLSQFPYKFVNLSCIMIN